MVNKTLTVAWISDFPVEWLPDLPAPLQGLPRRHPATWQIALLEEFEKEPGLRIHPILLRQRIKRSFSFERNGSTFHVLKAAPWMRIASLFWVDTWLIGRLCKQIRPDLLHAWGIEKGAPLIGHRLGFPYLMTVQGLLGWYKEVIPLPRYDRFTERLERISLPRAPVVTTESTFAVQYLKKRYPRLRIQQAEHAPNRVFLEVRRKPQNEPVHFISVGGLGFRKGTDMLFNALEKLVSQMQFKLTVITNPNPEYVESLRTMASGALWERVRFRHHALPQEVAKELETATMLLLPTRADTSPNAVKEAVVAGVPVVASSVGGIPDYVFPDKNGLLFPAGAQAEFVRAIQLASGHPLFSKGKVEPETLAKARDYLSPERMAGNFLKAYETALTTSEKPKSPKPE